MKVFLFDNGTNSVIVNEPEVLLIKEFAALWTNERNKTKEDPTGVCKSRAYRELVYIWLMLDWASPYSDYTEQERHIQNESRALKLIKSAQGVVDRITDYFDTIDLSERDPVTNRPVWKVADVMKEMQSVSKVIEELKTLEYMYKKEQEEETDNRGGGEEGRYDR